MMMMMAPRARARFHWKDAFQREDVRRIWKYGIAIMITGFVGKQLVWEIAQSNIKEIHQKQHEEASEALERAYADGRRLAALKRARILAQIAEVEEAQSKQK
ncbi:hypothetical protein NSK_006691 [Nannochloropsis salina CCMP1776]|uniref:Uncharacterized protein n=1 Tax=Nannochloropsis salina CCMP1776 TaxID=1027361 RepID=A0A4D9CWW2_9STRA|nr:hypothetical protein NSK_006691 [Nannochloropsis salina CCMP1776]|eukprot:TFJ82023.1 hypothetical protein NSK_006691 [Nannochloropsis salina CCMP1776]